MRSSQYGQSPKKQRVSTAGGSPNKSFRVSSPQRYAVEDTIQTLSKDNQQLQFALGERDVEMDRMKTTLVSLNEKLAILTDIKNDADDFKSNFGQSENKRNEMQVHIVQTSESITVETRSHDVKHQEKINTIQNLDSEIQQLKQYLAKRENEHLQTLESVNQEHYQELKAKCDQIDRIQNENLKLNAEKDSFYNYNLTTQQSEHNAELKKLQDYNKNMLQKLQEENKAMLQKLQEDDAFKLSNLQNKYNTELVNLKSQYNSTLTQLNQTHSREVERLNKDREELRKTKDYRISYLEQELEKQRSSYEIEINRLTTIIITHEATILKKSGTIMSLEEMLAKKTDVEQQLDEALRRERDNQAARDALQQEVESASDYILELEEKVYKANKTSLELLKQLKDAEMEIETLKQYIVDLKQRIAVYIPVKDDTTDKKLAEFINNYPERSKLKIMFMRESDGVYQFGTKRVAVKVEAGNIKIRVGGGYLSIDEFLDQYTPVELEKLERKDPLKRFSEKVAVQKTIVNAGVRESSPVGRAGSPGGSPGRRTITYV